MKPSPLMTLAVTAGIVAAAGCSGTTTGPASNAPSSHPATAVAATPTAEPSLGVSYPAQVELPFGELVNHLGWVASDAEGNVYVLDDLNFRVLELPVR